MQNYPLQHLSQCINRIIDTVKSDKNHTLLVTYHLNLFTFLKILVDFSPGLIFMNYFGSSGDMQL
jgi:hypothetical protein